MARAAAIESAFPKSVPPIAMRSDRSPSGPFTWVSRSAIASVIPQAPNGTPPAIDFPIVTMSGARPHCRVRPPGPTTCVCVSSSARSVPVARVSSRSAAWNPGSGRIRPKLFVRAGSVRTSATRRPSSARPSAARSLNGTTTVPSVTSRGSPRSSGTSDPSGPISTSVSSRCPWYLPSKTRTASRPVATRATRIASVFAWVAESVYCHFGRP